MRPSSPRVTVQATGIRRPDAYVESQRLDAARLLLAESRLGIDLIAGRARAVALALEYDWRPDDGYARGALAEKYHRRFGGLQLPAGSEVKDLDQRGDRTRWERSWEVSGPRLTRDELELQGRRREAVDRPGAGRSSPGCDGSLPGDREGAAGGEMSA